ncbi:MAG: DUF2851 family protein [Bacteroidetes bacterium]|nr:MAG: DUF2851 family protein [Bacteroidota bacterium]
MKEDFIQFLWQYKLFTSPDLRTTAGEHLKILNPGTVNMNSGPDFSAAKLKIGDTLWAGNIEIHINSSDWFRHGHDKDDAYANIILHVVLNHDKEIIDKQGNSVPVFEVKSFFDPSLLGKYEKIIYSKTWIPCAGFIHETDKLILMNWLSRLLVERLENKSGEILKFLKYFENNWEQTFYYFLARNFGFKINASPFALLAQITPYLTIARHKNDLTQIEALLFGQAGFLENNYSDAYPDLLKREYQFLRKKYDLKPMDKSLWKFGKLRPPNFPTIRIAQFAALIYQSSGLFSKLIETDSISEIKNLFTIKSSPYWNNHYQFDKPSLTKTKRLGNSSITNIIINTLVPVKFVYGSENLKPEIKEQAITLLAELEPEKNHITNNWEKTGIKPVSAAESQALIELKKYYCTPKKCLNCAIGLNLIRK